MRPSMLTIHSTIQHSSKLHANESAENQFSEILLKIKSSIGEIDFKKMVRSLNDEYVMNFPVEKLINSKIQKHVFQFFRKFFTLIFLKINQSIREAVFTEQEHFNQALISSVFEIKECYCKLTQILPKNNKIEHLQVICFVTALLSRKILTDYAKTLEISQHAETSELEGESQGQEEIKGECEIEEQIYIIVIFQTVGQLVSPYVFRFLKKKYIKSTIFQGDQATHRTLVLSLKHIKENITKKDVILNRKKKNPNEKGDRTRISFQLEKNSMKNLLKEALKIRESFSLKQGGEQVDKKTRSVNYYTSKEKSSHKIKITIPKQCSVKAMSSSAKMLYEFANKYNCSMIKKKLLQANIHTSERHIKKKFMQIDIPKQNQQEIRNTSKMDSLRKQMVKLQDSKSSDSLIEKISQSYRFRLERNTTPGEITETPSLHDSKQVSAPEDRPIVSKDKENLRESYSPERMFPKIVPEKQLQEGKYRSIEEVNWRSRVSKSQAYNMKKKTMKSQKLKWDKKSFWDDCEARNLVINHAT